MLLKRAARVICVFSLLIAWGLTADAAPRSKQQVDQELAKVRADLATAQQEMTQKAKVLWQTQHDLEYKDPSVAKLREEIVGLEKQLLDKRRELDFKLSLLPEMKQVEKDRRQLFEHLETLKQEQTALLNEAAALENADALSK